MTLIGAPRLDPRLRLRLPVDITPRWNGAQRVRMETINLSGSGAAVLTSIYLPLKTQVSVVMRLPAVPGQKAVDVKCEAVVVNIEEIGHERKRWKVGLYFLNMAQPDQQALKRFVYGALEAPGEQMGSPAAQGRGGIS